MVARMDSYDLFIAAPMSAIAPGDYATGRKDILSLMESLSGRHPLRPHLFRRRADRGHRQLHR